MDVYLVPASRDRYELYCEVSVVPPGGVTSGPGWWRRLAAVFQRALAEGEAEQNRGPADQRSDKGRIRRAITRRLAEAVAEQRLLWHLRRQTTASLVSPDDLTPAAAAEIRRRLLTIDRDRHLRWCIFDGLLTLVSIPAALIPGPNVLGYYFLFRTVGHFLSVRGANQGLRVVQWTAVASPHLTALRDALPLDPPARTTRVGEIAAALGLDRLTVFVERVADGPS